MEHLHKKNQNVKKKSLWRKMEYLLPYTGSRKVLENIPELVYAR